jgi:hypothetical protein
LDNAASAFLLNRPYVYDSNMPSGLQSHMPNLAQVIDGSYYNVLSIFSRLFTMALTDRPFRSRRPTLLQ